MADRRLIIAASYGEHTISLYLYEVHGVSSSPADKKEYKPMIEIGGLINVVIVSLGADSCHHNLSCSLHTIIEVPGSTRFRTYGHYCSSSLYL